MKLEMKFTVDKKLHSREHVLAEDLSRALGEPKNFAAYLGIAKRYYERDLRALVRTVREKKDLPVEAYGKYFFACIKSLNPTSEYLRLQRHKQSKLKKKKKKPKHAKPTANRKRTGSSPADADLEHSST